MRVGLVLGSGGARGYAHIGVIEELRARGHDIVGISGSSMGALVGGLEAAGKLDEYAEWARSLTQRAILRLLDPSITALGVLRAEKIHDAVRDILGEALIEDLPIPFTAVSTDLISGKSVWLQRGPVDAAIRASIAIPGVIAPYVLDGRLLADGGILDPLPIAPITAVNADITIVVSLSGDDPDAYASTLPSDPRPQSEWLNKLLRRSSALLETTTAKSMLGRFSVTSEADDDGAVDGADGEFVDTGDSKAVPKLNSFDVMYRTIDIAQAALARHQLAAYPPDIVIEIPRTAARSLDFHRAAEVIELGREAAGRALDGHEKALRSSVLGL
ncbi:MAG: patatin-like phospholipase family protein [Mycobacterium sp.]